MVLLLLNHVVLRALWKIDVYLISTLVNKSLYYYYYYYTHIWAANIIRASLTLVIGVRHRKKNASLAFYVCPFSTLYLLLKQTNTQVIHWQTTWTDYQSSHTVTYYLNRLSIKSYTDRLLKQTINQVIQWHTT